MPFALKGKALIKLHHLIGGLLLTLAILSSSAPADAKRVALVVGISDYKYSPKLTNPGRDAMGMTAALRASGFDVLQVLDPSVAALLESLEQFYTKAEGATAAVFFFAGHGLQFDGVNYLVPKDAQLRSETRLKQETVALQDVMIAIEKRANMTLVFLDACRDNPLAEELQRNAKGASRAAAVTRGLAPMAIRNPDTLLVFAAAPGKTASDGNMGNSPFTASLLRNMSEPGVEIELMLKRVTRDVVQETNGAQIPERLSRLTSEFVFNIPTWTIQKTGKPEVSPSDIRKEQPKTIASIQDQHKQAVIMPSTAAQLPAYASQGCIPLHSTLTVPIVLKVGTVLCSEDRTNKAIITRITERAVGYAIGSKVDNCQPSEQCAFSWVGSPRFRVVIEPSSGIEASMTATLVSW